MCRTEEARVYFKAGKNRDGYFVFDDLLRQVDVAINIFENRFSGARAIFAFDNAPTHQKRAADALSARHMPKTPGWKSQKAPERMRPGRLPSGEPQELYFPSDHPKHPNKFKGMAQILIERGIDITDSKGKTLNAECSGFKCKGTAQHCCCRNILFHQPDFQDVKPALVEHIEKRGHIAVFYPKFHCELNFIEQCWGYAKYRYRMLPRPLNEKEMQINVQSTLDSIPPETFRRQAISYHWTSSISYSCLDLQIDLHDLWMLIAKDFRECKHSGPIADITDIELSQWTFWIN